MQDVPSAADILTATLTDLDGRATLLRLTGEIDISSVHVLTEHLATVARQGKPNVVIDATGVSFMDSTGLHALVEGKKLIHQSGTRIVLVPSRQVRRVLELVFPEQVVAKRVNTIEEALAALDDNAGLLAE